MKRRIPLALVAALSAAPACTAPRATAPSPGTPQQRVQLLLEKDPAGAVALADALAAGAPGDLELARLRAEAWVKAGRGAELVAKTPPGTAVGHYTRGLALYARAADVPRALEELRAAVALAPSEPELHYRLGLALLESESDRDALAELERAVTLAPRRSGWQLPLAKAYHRNGRPRDAVQALRKLVEEAPTPKEVSTARELMAQVSSPLAGVPRAAQARLDQALQLLNTQDSPQQAIVTLEELLLEFPDCGFAHALLGLAFQRLDDAGRAVDEFRRAAELSPEDGRPHYYLAILWQGRQRDAQAREALQRALERDPLIDDAWARLGDLALAQGDTATALRCYGVLAGLQPNQATSFARLALVQQLQGDAAAAEASLRKGLELSPDSPDLQLRMGQLYAERARSARTSAERKAHKDEAERWINKVLDAQPENAAATAALESLRSP